MQISTKGIYTHKLFNVHVMKNSLPVHRSYYWKGGSTSEGGVRSVQGRKREESGGHWWQEMFHKFPKGSTGEVLLPWGSRRSCSGVEPWKQPGYRGICSSEHERKPGMDLWSQMPKILEQMWSQLRSNRQAKSKTSSLKCKNKSEINPPIYRFSKNDSNTQTSGTLPS